MSLEDASVLGECLSRLALTSKPSPSQKSLALNVYEKCRKSRTEMVVQRGNLQQYLYHLHDGPEQEQRDRKMRMMPTPPGEALAWRDPELSPRLLGYECEADVSYCLAFRSSWTQRKC
jgi:salicylate hydroxylase